MCSYLLDKKSCLDCYLCSTLAFDTGALLALDPQAELIPNPLSLLSLLSFPHFFAGDYQ